MLLRPGSGKGSNEAFVGRAEIDSGIPDHPAQLLQPFGVDRLLEPTPAPARPDLLQPAEEGQKLAGKGEKHHIPVGVDAPGLQPVQHPVLGKHLPPDPADGLLIGFRCEVFPDNPKYSGWCNISHTVRADASKQRSSPRNTPSTSNKIILYKCRSPRHQPFPEHFLILYQNGGENHRGRDARALSLQKMDEKNR